MGSKIAGYHPPPRASQLAEALEKGEWGQFQFYGLFPGNPALMLIGDVTEIEIQDGGFKCHSKNPLRARGEGWEKTRQPESGRVRRSDEDEPDDRKVAVRLLNK